MKKGKIYGFNKEKLGQWLLYWLVFGVGFVVLMFLVTSTWIGMSVKDKCSMAQGRYEGDCVEALIQMVDGEYNSNRDRNYAIWALGQMGDVRGREVLQKYYTGVIPDREPYDAGLSQYEIKKALKLLDTGVNLTHLVW